MSETRHIDSEATAAVVSLPEEVAAGGGMGLLVSMLLGLSVAQVVGGVVAALAALLGGFFGLSGRGRIAPWRVSAFGVACVIGIVAGLTIRSGALLAPTVEQDVAQWERAGYPKDQALALVALARLGVQPAGTTVAARTTPDATSNALFAGHSGICARLQGLPEAAQLRILQEAGDASAALAAAAQASGNRSAALQAGLKVLCG